MRFGATTLPLAGWLADPRQPEASQVQRLAAIRQLVSGYGLSAVELSLDLALIFPTIFDEDFFASVAELQQELGFVGTVHLPFLWVDPASLNETVRRASLQSVRRAVELTRAVEIDTYVLHLWGLATVQILSVLELPSQRQAILAALAVQVERSLEEACQMANPRDICVENLELPAFDLALPLIERWNASICLDVGHLAWQDESPLAFLARHGERIREVHLHDARRVPAEHEITAGGPRPRVRDHLALGQGDLDYVAFLRGLEAAGFQGTVILENNTAADLEQSLDHLAEWL